MAATPEFFPLLRKLLLPVLPLFFLSSPASGGDSLEHYYRALDHIREFRPDAGRTELLLAIAFCPDNPAPLYLELGILEVADNKPLAALTNFRKALVHDPSLTEASYRLADTLTEIGRIKEAEEIWLAIVAERPEEAEAWIRLAETREEREDYFGSLEAYGDLLRTDPSHPQALYGFFLLSSGLRQCGDALSLLTNTPAAALPGLSPVFFTASCLRRSGRPEEALSLLRRDWPDFDDEPSRPALLAALAEHLYLLDREEECATVLKEIQESGGLTGAELSVMAAELSASDLSNTLVAALLLSSRRGENLPVLWAVPKILLRLGRSDDAYAALLDAVRIAWSAGEEAFCLQGLMKASGFAPPEAFEHFFLLSSLLEESGMTTEAAAALRQGQSIVPDSPASCLKKARLLYEIRKTSDAYATVLSCLAASASNTETCLSAALFAIELDRNKEALFWASRVLRDAPDHPEANAFAGYALFGLSRWAEAAEFMEKALSYSPANHALLFYLAQALDQTGRKKEALPLMEEAVRLNDAEPAYHNYLGYLMAEIGTNLSRAEKHILQALHQDPENPYYLDSLGWTLFRMGRFDEALLRMLEAVAAMEAGKLREAIIYEHTGDVYQALQNRKKARSYWKKALRLDPRNKSLRKKAR